MNRELYALLIMQERYVLRDHRKAARIFRLAGIQLKPDIKARYSKAVQESMS